MQRLSKRMKAVLKLLAEPRNKWSMKKTKKYMVSEHRLMTSLGKTLGWATSTEEFEPSEEEVAEKYYDF